MKKLISKISGLVLGLAMIVGVGAGLSSNKKVCEVEAVNYGTSETINCPAGTVTGTSTADKKATFETNSFNIVHANDGNTSSGVASYSPWRIYANHTITISSKDGTTKIAKIEATSSSTYYGTWTGDTGWSINTASSSGGKTTFTNDNGSTSATFKTSAQARWSSLVIYPLSSGPQYASPYIKGVEEGDLYAPTHENISLSIEWGAGTVPTVTNYSWAVDNDCVSLTNSNTATPTLVFNSSITTYQTAKITLKVNDDDTLKDVVSINVAPHIFDELAISDSRKSTFNVNEDFSIGNPSITAKYIDKDNKSLSPSDLTFYIGGTKTSGTQINLGDKMLKSFDGKKVYAYYTDGTSRYTSWNITVNDRVMPTPVFEGGWNKVTANDLSIGDQIVLGGAVQGFIGDGNDSHKDWFVMSTNQKTNNRGVSIVEFNSDQSKITTLPTDAQILTIVAGNKEGTIALSTGSGYLAACSSSKNYMHTDASLSDNSSFTYSILNGVCTFVAQGDYSNNTMQFNVGNKSSAALFSLYSASSQAGICVYRNTTVDTDKAYVQKWINENLHFQTIATSDEGTGECLSSSYYITAKTNLMATNNNDSSSEDAIILAFTNPENTEFTEAVQRYESWARACGDTQPYAGTTIVGLARNLAPMNAEETSEVVVISTIVLCSVGMGVFFLFRKKRA